MRGTGISGASVKKRVIFFVILIVLLFVTFLNYKNYKIYGSSFLDFINKKCDIKIIENNKTNVFIVLSPFDCNICFRYLISIEFIQDLNKMNFERGTINYIVTGKLKDKEINCFLGEILGLTDIYSDKKEYLNRYLYKNFGSERTPFICVVDNNGDIPYYKYISIKDPKEEQEYFKEIFRKIKEVI